MHEDVVDFDVEFEQDVETFSFDQVEEDFDNIRRNLCDRCGTTWAAASAVRGNSKLYFCGHHLRVYMPELIMNGFSAIDPRNELDFQEGYKQNRLQGEDHG